MNLELLETMLIDAGIVEPIYLFAMPDECDLGVLLKLPLQGIPLDHELPGYHHGQIQAIVRAPDQSSGNELARRVQVAMTVTLIKSLPVDGPEEILFNYIRPTTLPIRYPRSENGVSIEWSINFDCCFVIPI